MAILANKVPDLHTFMRLSTTVAIAGRVSEIFRCKERATLHVPIAVGLHLFAVRLHLAISKKRFECNSRIFSEKSFGHAGMF